MLSSFEKRLEQEKVKKQMSQSPLVVDRFEQSERKIQFPQHIERIVERAPYNRYDDLMAQRRTALESQYDMNVDGAGGKGSIVVDILNNSNVSGGSKNSKNEEKSIAKDKPINSGLEHLMLAYGGVEDVDELEQEFEQAGGYDGIFELL